MQIRVGHEIIYNLPQPTPMILVVSIHYSRVSDSVIPDHLTTCPSVPVTACRDGFGNWCSRIVAPSGRLEIRSNGVVRDTGLPDALVPLAPQYEVKDLPGETLVFLLGSRYCETDLLSPVYGLPDFAAWMEFYLGGRWYIFDPRDNVPRIGRVLIARGCDASDVAIVTTFGPNTLESFRVWTDEMEENNPVPSSPNVTVTA